MGLKWQIGTNGQAAAAATWERGSAIPAQPSRLLGNPCSSLSHCAVAPSCPCPCPAPIVLSMENLEIWETKWRRWRWGMWLWVSGCSEHIKLLMPNQNTDLSKLVLSTQNGTDCAKSQATVFHISFKLRKHLTETAWDWIWDLLNVEHVNHVVLHWTMAERVASNVTLLAASVRMYCYIWGNYLKLHTISQLSLNLLVCLSVAPFLLVY